MAGVMAGWPLDPISETPLHLQFEARLRERIASGEWKPGERIPSERELMQFSGISRATVRQALASLVHLNVLEKVHGSGTFVARPRFEQPLSNAYSFSEQMRAQGQELIDTVLAKRSFPADARLAARLQIAEGSPVLYLQRLRALNGAPMMVSTAYIPARFAPDLITTEFSGSLYRTLAERYGWSVVRAIDRIEAAPADTGTAKLLGVRAGTPLLVAERIAYTTGDQILHFGENLIRGDMCRFRMELQGSFAALEVKT